MQQEFAIKNMICPRCVKVVSDELTRLGLKIITVSLGKAVVENKNVSVATIKERLAKNGFQLIEDKNEALANQLKTALIEKIYTENALHKFTLTEYLEKKMNEKYTVISRVFSKTTNKTIEQFFIELKIEKTKELIEQKQHSFSEIAYALGYQSPGHLSAQFKKNVGLTMSEYKKTNPNMRKAYSEL